MYVRVGHTPGMSWCHVMISVSCNRADYDVHGRTSLAAGRSHQGTIICGAK